MICLRNISFSIVNAAILLVLSVSTAQALPFNDDMVNNPNMTGRVMRALPKDSISVGSLNYRMPNREEANKLTNPIKKDATSIANGQRLFQVNCVPCHGHIESEPYVPGAVSKFLPAPNLALDMYKEKPSDSKNGDGRTDGSIYGTIHFGSLSTLMPPLGWKFSPTEHWDLVNYVRSIQEKAK